MGNSMAYLRIPITDKSNKYPSNKGSNCYLFLDNT